MEVDHSTPRHKQDIPGSSIEDLSQGELLLYSINYFHDSLEKRAEMGARTSRWTNRVIRSGMLGLMLTAFSILLLVVIVAKQMNQVAEVMVKMDRQMEIIVMDIDKMEHFVHAIGDSVATMPPLVDEITTMEQHVGKINGHMSIISAQIIQTDQVVEQLVNDVKGMDQHLGSVTHIVQGMDHNLNRVSRPFRMFNDMVPMP
ncbi:MAG: hypothetical protein HON68_04130 [Gammaproteobacteria bacterium]|jgi:uncharacterized protein YoxC|nr:hypothetical protein [Gammaproteobacteria bacterium]MBT3488723.1 hypothetical protein [Gammaproteobacteria bacterium]MBT3717974.1 hypothetical protein [Gammaproteobacteria bacterium]MBT3845426.1 hypothetical protein [Gammaproteobacteria bacterium]MBT3893933.1 hypothetical protein [Gammaproteobacteria bacterium]